MRALVCAALIISASGCEKSEIACAPAVAAMIDAARACLLPPTQIPGVNVCRSDSGPTDDGAMATCVVHATGRYVAQLPPGAWLVGDVRTPTEPCDGFLTAPPCP